MPPAQHLELRRVVDVTERDAPSSHDATSLTNCDALLPFITETHDASPIGWSQNWAHDFSDAANCSGISTFRGSPSLPWAQGVAGSNPVAPTTSLENLRKVQRVRE